jgi:lactate permease
VYRLGFATEESLNITIDVSMALLPFAVLFSAFLILRWDAVRAVLLAWVIELAEVLAYYHMPVSRSIEASLWGNLSMWSGFLVLYTGQIFGQAYRNTGLLEVLLESVQSIIPRWDQQGRALALVSVVGGFISAFNGFATYPVTIPGLVELGFDGLSACASYLVYFSWTLPFNSLFIAPTISNAASHVPVVDIVRVAGLLSIPLVFLSLLGFVKVLGFRFFEWESQVLFWMLGLGNVVAIILFTQVWPAYYLLMLVAGAAISLGSLYVYGRFAMRQPVPSVVGAARPSKVPPSYSGSMLFRAYAPLVLGVMIVLLTKLPGIADALTHVQFSVAAWGYSRVTVGIFTSAGFFLLVTSLVCYPFRCKEANVAKDFALATRRSRAPLATLLIGSATVYLMVDTGQIALLGKVLSGGGKLVYTSLYPVVAFLGGMAFGQGLPGDFLLSQMQVNIAPVLGIPLMLLVGIVTVVTMGPPNALKPTQIAYAASLAKIKGRDGEIFRICLPWQILQLVVTAILAVILVLVWR